MVLQVKTLFFGTGSVRYFSNLVLTVYWLCSVSSLLQADTPFSFAMSVDRVSVMHEGKPIAEYRFADRQVSHPYWSPLRTISGKLLTRNHPPVDGVDAMDHVGLHTGVWLSFGDISGNDYWRLKTPVKQTNLELMPKEGTPAAAFRVENVWNAQVGDEAVLSEETTFRFHEVEQGYVLEWDTALTAVTRDVIFGEQEEMGLGLRTASSMAVDKNLGGRMLDSVGRRNGKEIWGQQMEWCDYAGPTDGMWCGITLLVDTKNGRACRAHARDYGFIAMNPFSTKVFTQGEATPYTLEKGKKVRLRFGIYVHESQHEANFSVLPAKRIIDAIQP